MPDRDAVPGRAAAAPERHNLDALRAHDPDAWAHLVRTESERLYAAIRRRVRNEDDARSLVQETFLQAVRCLDTFRGHSRISTWLYGIALNVARRHLRRLANQPRYMAGTDLDRLASDAKHPNLSDGRPDARLEQHERRRVLLDAIDRLPDTYRVILTMRDMKGRTTSEVAAALGLSEVAVRVRLHRARSALRGLVGPYFTG